MDACTIKIFRGRFASAVPFRVWCWRLESRSLHVFRMEILFNLTVCERGSKVCKNSEKLCRKMGCSMVLRRHWTASSCWVCIFFSFIRSNVHVYVRRRHLLLRYATHIFFFYKKQNGSNWITCANRTENLICEKAPRGERERESNEQYRLRSKFNSSAFAYRATCIFSSTSFVFCWISSGLRQMRTVAPWNSMFS